MHNKLLHRFFFQTIKRCCQLHVQAAPLFKISIGFLLCCGYMRNNLVHLGGYSTHRDAADMSNLLFLLFVYMIKEDHAHTEISPFEEKWDEQKSSYELNLFVPHVYEHVSSLARWDRLYINTKVYYCAY